MIEKPKRPKKIPNQDNKQPQTIQELIKRYDLDNTKIYDFLDELVTSLKQDKTNIDESIENIISNEFRSNSRNDSINFNDFTKNGFYMVNIQKATNAPNNYATGMLLVFGSYYISQLYIAYLNGSTAVFARASNDKGVTWASWAQLS